MDRYTAAHAAGSRGFLVIIQVLIKNDVTMSQIAGNDRWTPLLLASQNWRAETFRFVGARLLLTAAGGWDCMMLSCQLFSRATIKSSSIGTVFELYSRPMVVMPPLLALQKPSMCSQHSARFNA